MLNKKILCALLWCGALNASLSVTRTGSSYDLAINGPSGRLIAASSAALSGADALYGVTRAEVVASTLTGLPELTLKSLTPLSTQVNGAMQNVGTAKEPRLKPLLSANPLYEVNTHAIGSFGDLPVVVTGTTADNARTVVMVTNVVDGTSVRMNRDGNGSLRELKDADGAATTTIRGVTAGSVVIKSSYPSQQDRHHPFVLAAVTPTDSADFAGQDAAGIAVMYNQVTGLEPVDATGGRGAAKAAALSDALIKIGSTGSIDDISAMYWDQKLQRLYVALDLSSGGVAVVVGQLAMTLVGREVEVPGKKKKKVIQECDAKLTLRPVIFDTAGGNEDANWNGTDYIVAEEDSGLNIQKLGVMHASTQNSYLVANRNDNRVYAVPIVNAVSSTADEASIGALALITDSATPARNGSTAELYTTSSEPALVGAGVAPATIHHMVIKGDAVFVSCAGGTSASQGIFSSVPLFDASGAIARWTPWTRVAGAVRKAYGFSFDEQARPNYLSGANDTSRDTLYVASWGMGSGNELWGGPAGDAGSGLLTALNGSFPFTSGGIHTVRSFVGENFGAAGWYDVTHQIDNSAIIGCLGRNRCALFMTSEDGTPVTAANYDTATHLLVHDLADDSIDLGMLTSMAFSRSTSTGLLGDEGWIFVGGHSGLAVLSKTDGSSGSDLNDLNDRSRANGYRFIELKKADGSSFDHVRCIQTTANSVYVIDAVGLYRFDYEGDAFKDDQSALGETLIASPSVILSDVNQTFLDMVILNDHAVLATTSGLWTMHDRTLANVTNTVGSTGWRQLTITPEGTDSFGVCAQLHFVPSDDEANGGMLYVLTADTALNVAIVYRVAIPNSDTTAVFAQIGAVNQGAATTRRSTTMLGQLREQFYTDGAHAIDAGSHHHTFGGVQTPLVRVLPISTTIGAIDSWVHSTQPSIVVTDAYNTVGSIVRDAATGTVMVSGMWGLQVLQ